MSKKEKLIARFLSMPSDFHYDEMVKLLGYYGFEEVKKGKLLVQELNLRIMKMYR